MKKKLIIIFIAVFLLLGVGTLLFFIFKPDQDLKTDNSVKDNSFEKIDKEEVDEEESENIVVDDNVDSTVENKQDIDNSKSDKEDNGSTKKEETQASQSSSSSKNNSNNQSNQSKPQNNNQSQQENEKEESDSSASNDSSPAPKEEVDTTTYVVDTNDIFYPIHKGTSDYSDGNTCYNKGIEMSFKYPSIISYYNCIDVMSINIATGNRKIMGYYLEYIFADTTYDNLDDCNNKGNALKKDLPSKFSSFKCQKDSDNYILKIK